MSNIRTNPYLFFKGNALEAMKFYQSVFGGELDTKTYADFHVPAEGDLKDDSIMHASLNGGDVVLMASDTNLASPKAAKITISLNGDADSEARLTEVFKLLSDGAEVQTPLKKEMWGDLYGSLTDKYGIDWMINIESGAKEGAAS
ncbi:VOC family protein [Patescibacteria group bacterium]|nr:MAG: VOC family protein [Patescibacteria group bacterium]